MIHWRTRYKFFLQLVLQCFFFMLCFCLAFIIDGELSQALKSSMDLRDQTLDPIKKPSVRLRNYKKRKEEEHESIIREMRRKQALVNETILTQLRLKSEYLKKMLNDIDIETDRNIKQCNTNDIQNIQIQNKKFDMTATLLHDLQRNRKEKINQYYESQQMLEKYRSNQNKMILKEAYQKIRRIGFQLPQDIYDYFYSEIRNINAHILENLRAYATLNDSLLSRYSCTMRKSFENLFYYKEQWYNLIKNKVLVSFNEERLKDVSGKGELLIEKRYAEKFHKQFTKQDMKLSFLWRHFDPMYVRSKDMLNFSKEVNDTVNKLDNCAVNLVKMYKVALLGVFNGYFEGVKDITENMMSFGLLEEQDLDNIEQEYCYPVVETITKRYDMELQDLLRLWNDVIADLQKKLKKTFSFLLDSSYLWDGHFDRLDNVQKIVMEDLYATIQHNDKEAQAEEIKLNIYLDWIRQGTEDNIDEPLEIVFDMLDELMAMYYKHHESEIAVVMKYKELSELAIEVLSAKLRQFLNFNPKDPEVNPTVMRLVHCVGNQADGESEGGHDIREDLIPKQIKMAQYHIDAVQNWMLGLWEAIENCVQSNNNEIRQQCEEWIKTLTCKISKRLEVKLAVHQPRYATVKEDTYELRKTKHKLVKSRIERHQAGMDKIIAEMEDINSAIEERYKHLQDDWEPKLDSAEERVRDAKIQALVEQIQGDVNYHQEKFYQRLAQKLTDNHFLIEEKCIILQKAQVDFVKSIKFFSEQGNCHSEEGKQIAETVKKLEKDVAKKIKIVYKNSEKIHAKYRKALDAGGAHIKQIIETSLEEFHYNETAVGKIKELQQAIKREAYELKYKIKKGVAHYKDMKVQALNNLGHYEFLETFEELSKTAAEICNGIREYMLIPDSLLQETSDLLKTQSTHIPVDTKPLIDGSIPGNVIEPDYDLRSTKASTRTDGSKSTFDSFGHQTALSVRSAKQIHHEMAQTDGNYIRLLYKSKPLPNGSFIVNCYNKIYESFLEVQALAKDFYAKHLDFINKKNIQTTYEDFLGEVLGKYLLYHIQVNMLWIEQANEFIKLVSDTQDLLTSYIPQFIEQYKQNAIFSLKLRYESVKQHVNNIRLFKKETFEMMHKRLKPCLGHPRNRLELEEINNNVLKFINSTLNTIYDAVQPFKTNQLMRYEDYNNELHTINETLNSFVYKTALAELVEKIVQQVKVKMDQIKQVKHANYDQPDGDEKSILSYISRKLMDFTGQMILPSESVLSIRSSQNETMRQWKSLENLHIHGSVVKKSIEEYGDEYAKMMKEIQHIEKTSDDDSNKWECVWKADLQRVCNLYKVKHDIPETADA